MSNELTESEIQEIKKRNYEVKEEDRLSKKGALRDTYLTKYKSGNVETLRVMKIQKVNIDEQFIQALINASRKNRNLNEVFISNQINNQNIIQILDSFFIGNRVANIEDYYEAQDLETWIERFGPVSNEDKFENIFYQVIDAAKYLNCDKGILHRDIKPSNILVGEESHVKIGDLESCCRKHEVEEKYMPTRGGANFAHPLLLNALIGDTKSCASERTEVYSIGASMFYALTGENIFNYKIEIDEDGKEIIIGNKSSKISLLRNHTKIEKITTKEHEKILRKQLKLVPRKYRNLIYKCLTLNNKKEIKGTYELKQEFDKIKGNNLRRFMNNACSAIKPAMIGAAITAVLGGIIVLGIYASKVEDQPSLRQIAEQTLRTEDFKRISLETLNETEKLYAHDILVPYMKKAKKRLPKIKQELKDKGVMSIEYAVNSANGIQYMDKRIVSAWYTACLLADRRRTEKMYKEEQREWPTYVSKNFMIRSDSVSSGYYTDSSRIAFGVRYLKLCTCLSQDIGDIYAKYFCTLDEINTARSRTKSLRYLPKIVKGRNDAPTIAVGYRRFLPYEKSEIINMAIALYLITDEQGKVNFENIPKLRYPAGYYDSKLSTPH